MDRDKMALGLFTHLAHEITLDNIEYISLPAFLSVNWSVEGGGHKSGWLGLAWSGL